MGGIFKVMRSFLLAGEGDVTATSASSRKLMVSSVSYLPCVGEYLGCLDIQDGAFVICIRCRLDGIDPERLISPPPSSSRLCRVEYAGRCLHLVIEVQTLAP